MPAETEGCGFRFMLTGLHYVGSARKLICPGVVVGLTVVLSDSLIIQVSGFGERLC